MQDTKPIEDPQALFMQFAPNLYFDSPIERASWNGETWFIVAEQDVPTGVDAFWHTIQRWTEEPQYVIPPLEKAIVKDHVDEDTRATDYKHPPFETYERELIPKRKSKDAPLLESVSYFSSHEDDQEQWARVTYRPVLSETTEEAYLDQLPFFYPKVRSYSFTYTACEPSVPAAQASSESKAAPQGKIRLEVIPIKMGSAAVNEPKMQYALKTLLHKLFKWCIQDRIGYKKKAHHDTLVPKETYTAMYQRLKGLYAQQLVSEWTEKTDPTKFVFEDIAIASYLICLWKEQESSDNKKPTFVDLGCGNGLLTYLLTKEGYQGFGVDIADRKIWTAFRENEPDRLRVETLYPAQVSYPGTDWVIANHADELSPWAPIIAAKSGDQCKFFVMPCCFYALDGTRTLSLRATSKEDSKYKAYTRYITDIAQQCGYMCELDYLRIPSTKNIAIIGRTRHKQSEPSALHRLESRGAEFVPRKNDREKEVLRRQRARKRSKIENSSEL